MRVLIFLVLLGCSIYGSDTTDFNRCSHYSNQWLVITRTSTTASGCENGVLVPTSIFPKLKPNLFICVSGYANNQNEALKLKEKAGVTDAYVRFAGPLVESAIPECLTNYNADFFTALSEQVFLKGVVRAIPADELDMQKGIDSTYVVQLSSNTCQQLIWESKYTAVSFPLFRKIILDTHSVALLITSAGFDGNTLTVVCWDKNGNFLLHEELYEQVAEDESQTIEFVKDNRGWALVTTNRAGGVTAKEIRYWNGKIFK